MPPTPPTIGPTITPTLSLELDDPDPDETEMGAIPAINRLLMGADVN